MNWGLVLFAAAFVQASDKKMGCFEEHLAEARTLNGLRKPLYAQISKGESKKVSWVLMSSEWFAQFNARAMDRDAEAFKKYGVDLTCESFVSMSSTPKFQPMIEPPPQLASYSEVVLSDFKDRAERLVDAGAFKELFVELMKEIQSIESEPRFHCMTRHLLESMALITKNAPDQIEKVKSKNGPEIEPLIRKLINDHLILFWLTRQIDNMAAPIQAKGIPIICNDVPNIGEKL